MTPRPWPRWAPICGLVFVVLIVVGFAVAGSSPSTDDSNAKIAAYLAKSSNQDKNLVAFVLLMAAMLFLIGFFAALRTRLTAAERGVGRLGSLAFGAGIASTVFLVTAICMFISTVLTAGDADKFTIDPGLYRLTQDMGYELWVASAVVGSLAMWATAGAVLKTGVLPRWYAWFSVVTGVISLAAFFFFPIFVYWLWIAVSAILLVLRPEVDANVRPDAQLSV
jgi:hypothetical protein